MATNPEYKKTHYEQILVRVKKGKRDEYKDAAEKLGVGQMELFRIAADEYISNHAGEKITPPVPTTTPENELSSEDKRLLDSAGKLTPEARKQLVKFLEILTARATMLDTKGGDSNGND